MALRRAATQLHRSISPFASSSVLGLIPRELGTSSHVSSSAATATADSEPYPEPETVGWGQTTVGKLLEAKPSDSGSWLWCSKDDWVIDAIRKMSQANVGSLLVFDPSKISIGREAEMTVKTAAKEAVVGIFTERDYLTKIVVKGRNSSSTRVIDVMTPADKLITVTPNHSVLDVMELMVEKNFRHMPVVSDSGTMAGMVSIRDVVHVMLKEHGEEEIAVHFRAKNLKPKVTPCRMAAEAVKLVGFFAQEMGLFFQHIHAATAKYNETGELPSSLFSAKQVKSLDKHARAGEKRKDKIKRKPTAFNYYVKEKLDEFKQKGIKVDEENSNNTLFKMAVTEWTKLSDDEKKAYSAKYAAELLGGEEESDSSDDDNSPKKRKL